MDTQTKGALHEIRVILREQSATLHAIKRLLEEADEPANGKPKDHLRRRGIPSVSGQKDLW